MTNARLLDRQASLLDYLTSSAAIFDGEPPADPALRGVDPARLRLEARFSFNKRMAKIRAVFPNTFSWLDPRAVEPVLRDFVDACPSVDIGRYHNAHQFLVFLEARWRCTPPEPPFLPDVARLELALAAAHGYDGAVPELPPGLPTPSIRRHASTTLLRCCHDVRSVFDDAADQTNPPPRQILLAVGWSEATRDVQVFEVAPALFALLEALEDWTPLDTVLAGNRETAGGMLELLIERHLLSLAL